MINIGGRFPTKRDATTYKKPITPLESKKCSGCQQRVGYGRIQFERSCLEHTLASAEPCPMKTAYLNPKVEKPIVITKA